MDEKRYKVIYINADGDATMGSLFETALNKYAVDGWRLHSFQGTESKTKYMGHLWVVLVNDNF